MRNTEQSEQDIEVIAACTDFVERANAVNSKNVRDVMDDLAFAGGYQYGKADRAARGTDRLEPVVNIIRNLSNSIVNPVRQNPFSVTIATKRRGDKMKEDLATALQAKVRGAESKSKAHTNVYINALKNAVEGGFGFAIVTNDYMDTKTFDQELKIERIVRPSSVVVDPFAKEPTACDMMECAIIDFIREGDAKRIYDIEVDRNYRPTIGSNTFWTPPKDSVSVITYYRKMPKGSSKKILGSDGNEYEDDDLPEGVEESQSREMMEWEIEVYKIVCDEVVNKTVIPIDTIPVVRFAGEMVYNEAGEIEWHGLTRALRWVAAANNYVTAAIMERVARAPKAGWKASFESIADYLGIWKNQSKTPTDVLIYKGMSSDGKVPLPEPQQINNSAVVDDLIGVSGKFNSDYQSIAGMPIIGNRMDARANETAESVLTQARQMEVSNYHFVDNYAAAIQQLGRIYVMWLPHVEKGEREHLMIDEEGGSRIESLDFAAMEIDPEEFGIDVSSGPIMATQRRDNIRQILSVAQIGGPEVSIALAPSLIRNSDLEGAEDVAVLIETLAAQRLGISFDKEKREDPEAVAALQKQAEAMQLLQDEAERMKLYIQQQDAKIAALETQSAALVYKANKDFEKAVTVESMKQEGENVRQEEQIVADAVIKAAESEAKVMELQAKQDAAFGSIGVQGVRPDFNAVQGMKNTDF